MLFYYIRHGDPIYEPDSLTVLGEKQAEALAKRLSLYGLDCIYSSSSNRAILTAKPTCELLKKEMQILDFANEGHAWRELTTEKNGSKRWLFQDTETRQLFCENDVLSLGHAWCTHPAFRCYSAGMDRIRRETFAFFASLGYEHIDHSGRYKVLRPNEERIALFAHQGFGIAFLSIILNIPYPVFANHFDICHSGMTVIDFREENGFAIPKVLTLSSDAHIYSEGLPTRYNHELYF